MKLEEKGLIAAISSIAVILLFMFLISINIINDNRNDFEIKSAKYKQTIQERDTTIKSLLSDLDWVSASDESSVAPVEESEGKWISIDPFKITHYGPDCEGCRGITASSTEPVLNQTIATDPNVIPTGSEVIINGQVYIAEDVGGAIQGNIIDMYVESETVANDLGVYYAEIFVKEK